MTNNIETDVLIIGCGIAGAISALELANSGLSVTLVTSAPKPEESNTYYAQGGIIYKGIDDPPEILKEDIIRAGAGLSNPKAVDILVHDGPILVKEILIDKIKVPFDKNQDDSNKEDDANNDRLSLVMEGGHSVHRIIHAADTTGKTIETSLIQELQKCTNIRWLTGHTAIDLLTPAHHSLNRLDIYQPISCVGAYLLDQASNQVIHCLAKKTILATGGLGQIFLRTTNPNGSRGDGLAMAYRAGARVINSEFVQFHPTAFYAPHKPCFLISEAVRGAGAKLTDEKGIPFMEKYDAHWKDLAPRDVVARSIHQEMLVKDVANVYLDLKSYMSAENIKKEFPSLYKQCLENDIDMTKDLIPVVPAAHYFCGGVWVDESGKTTLNNLYAIGEVSCTGLHGANRLASTSLLEGLVWGYRAANDIIKNIPEQMPISAENIPEWEYSGVTPADPVLLSQDMTVIKHIMWNYVGLVRSSSRLQRAIRELRHLEFEIERFYREAQLDDGLIGLRNAVRVALIITMSAWENKQSVGCHYRI